MPSAVVLLKIDVEGHEFEVLQGGTRTLREQCCVLVVEYNRDSRSEQMVATLRELGYRVAFQIDIPRASTRPFYRLQSLLGIRPEVVVGPFDGSMSYLPAVVFAKLETE